MGRFGKLRDTGRGSIYKLTLQINTDATDIALMATDYTPIELTYIRNIVSFPVPYDTVVRGRS